MKRARRRVAWAAGLGATLGLGLGALGAAAYVVATGHAWLGWLLVGVGWLLVVTSWVVDRLETRDARRGGDDRALG